MSVRIAQKNLPRAIGTLLPEGKIGPCFLEMPFPGIKIIHSESEMIVLMARKKRRPKIRDEMQLLVFPQPKPRSRKRKRRPSNRLQLQNALIKIAAALHVV